MIQKVKGTQDFIDLTLFNFIVSQTKKHLQDYNFTEIKTPILEHTELFKRSLGQQTDVVNKEMFLIQTRDEESSMCLRPEATAPIVRSFVENNITQIPWKVFTIAPCFRYERPQKGRFRQFHQISIEIIGSNAISQDALFIKMVDQLFKTKFLINNYAILINFLGCYEDRKKFSELLKKFLENVNDKICPTCQERREKNPLRIFDCKNPACQEIYKNAPKTVDHLCPNCNEEWKQLQETLELISVSFSVSSTLVRGLDYYDKTVFEFVSNDLGSQSAICGGGRYDRLVKEISEKEDQPAIGVGIGVERLLILLENIKDKLPIPSTKTLNLILPLSKEQHIIALLLANELHEHGLACDVLLDESSIKSMMRKANKLGAKYCLIIGSEEQNNREVTIKNMVNGEEKRVKQTEAVNHLV